MARLFGYEPIPGETERQLAEMRVRTLSLDAPQLRATGEGKVVLLHKIVERVAGEFPVHKQTIGDCVSHGYGTAVDVLRCVQVFRDGLEDEFQPVWTATEPIYAASRVEVGGCRFRTDGSTGSWGARAVKDYGVLFRLRYETTSATYDFTTYSGAKAKAWGRCSHGLPDDLEPVADDHCARTVTLVTSYVEARDSIANGFPVVVCSNQGFNSVRDDQGFCRRKGNWAHCMCFIGVDDKADRKGLLCMNSWGEDWVSGPKRHEQPNGSFWVDASTADRMLANDGSSAAADSWAVADFVGMTSTQSRSTIEKFESLILP